MSTTISMVFCHWIATTMRATLRADLLAFPALPARVITPHGISHCGSKLQATSLKITLMKGNRRQSNTILLGKVSVGQVHLMVIMH
jgi:hypothetical protein